MKRPKPNPFKIENVKSGVVKRGKLPSKSFDQDRRDAADEMRTSKKSDKKPSGRAPFGERKIQKCVTGDLVSAIMGGSKEDKAKYARKKAKEAAVKLLRQPATKGK